MKKLELHWKIIIGLVLGMIWAMLSARFGWAQFTDHWIMPWGTIFINMLKLIAVPLVLFSIISGVAGLTDVSRLGRMGAKTLGAYFSRPSRLSVLASSWSIPSNPAPESLNPLDSKIECDMNCGWPKLRE